MKVIKRSPRTGKMNSMELPITNQELDRWIKRGWLIQNAMPQLSDDQREFLLTGYTPDDWEMLFPPEQDDA